MRKAAEFFRTRAAVHGGYVYYYAPDLSWRLGEGKAGPQEIWVQEPGTPAVGMAFLTAHAATGDSFHLDAAREAAEALIHGQLQSGGWAASIDFDPAGKRAAQYRGGRARGHNNSTLDDGITQNALRFLIHMDRALQSKHAGIREAVETGLAALLAAQFPSGAFPKVWNGPVAAHPPAKAAYPDYDWRTENRIKEYWNLPTLNDDLAGSVSRLLAEAAAIRGDTRCKAALAKLGDFLLLAQMPEPQPGWAQQYDTRMRPAWARKFEPPALAGRESKDAMETLLRIFSITADAKYLEPLPRAIAWLKRSRLPDGRIARYYELLTNRPLYMTADYRLTNDDTDLPPHYGWKVESRIEAIEAALSADRAVMPKALHPPDADIRRIISELDAQGRWISKFEGGMLVGQPKLQPGESYVSSAVFVRNMALLSEFVASSRSR